MAQKASVQTAAPARGTFQPYIPATKTLPEFTPKAIVLGALFVTPRGPEFFNYFQITMLARGPEEACVRHS